MKKLLLFLLIASLAMTTQAQHMYYTKIAGVSGQTLNMKVWVPAGLDTTRPVNAVLFGLGSGELGVDPTKINVNGPFKFLTSTSSIGANLVIAAVQAINADPRPAEIATWIGGLGKLYQLNALVLAGFSRGGENMETYANDPIANFGLVKGLILACSQGSFEHSLNSYLGDFNASIFARNAIPILRCEGDGDFTWTYNDTCHLALAKIAPKLDRWVYYPGAGHGDPVCADTYNPSPASITNFYKALNGKSSYQWADSVMGGTPPPPVVYSSTAQSAIYVKTCSCGIPDSVTYTVPAGKYTSTVSQAAANQLASADMTANGQTYANTTGVCAPTIILICPVKGGQTFTLYSDGSWTVK